jgi:CubicO group peptidase (beta-lactamase class C family)
MTEESEIHIFSMSKLVTTVTALTLVEENRLSLADPVEKFFPELANRQVLVGGTAEAPQLEPAKRSITIRDLLTQTSGLTYDLFARGPLGVLWQRADLDSSPDLTEFVRRLATLPLAHQPGTHWTYGVNTDLLGAIIERVYGQDLETAMRERVLGPLGMTHTTFRPNAGQAAQLAVIYHRTPAGGLEPDAQYNTRAARSYASGGGGLVSTLHDYTRFAQMLLAGGTLDGTRILGRKTVEMMSTDQIGSVVPLPGGFGPRAFGFGVRVRLPNDPDMMALGSVGAFGWDGAATTFVTIDPKERLVAIALLQHRPWNESGIFEKFQNAVYQALAEEPHL